MKRSALAGAVLAFTINGACAANWTTLIEGSATAVYVDTSSIVHDKNLTRTRVRVVFGDPQPYSAPFPTKSMVSLWSFNCLDKTWAMGETTMVGTAPGEVSVSPEYPDDYDNVVPDSMQKLVMDYVCKKS
ncbi:surface-adhesin E family protein [Burkholderia sp. Z1]|uniref:surface-adhesin E family protein n=1 Tax=Burkholderia sp. Z1 TaxID=2759039 RepID=UPI00186840A7|nr:surface-adhesin E family protein [Burkholderia sp. Z1]